MKADQIKEVILEIAKRQEYELTEAQLQDIRKENILINVSFLGEFGTGKSTIVNNLIGRDLLPTYVEPTSAIITEIICGDHDEYVVEHINEKNETILESIEFHQLASEVMKHETNKKIHIIQEHFGILNRDVLIVDTPGVSSIYETHTDVTFGYLPYIDVAFLVVSVTTGDAPESLMEFLRSLPTSFIDKIYFILNKIELIPQTGINKIEQSFRESLSQIIPNPKIIKISALEARKEIINGDPSKIMDTSMAPLMLILNDEVPKIKRDVEEKRRKEALVMVGRQVIEALETKIDGLKYTNEEIIVNINIRKADLQKNEVEFSSFRKKFEDVKESISLNLTNLVNETVSQISFKLEKGESIDEEMKSFVENFNSLLESELNKLESVSRFNLHNSFSLVMGDKIERETKLTIQIANTLRDFLNYGMWLVLIPGSSIVEKGVSGGHTLFSSGVSTLKKYISSDKGIIKAIGSFQRNNSKLLSFVGDVAKGIDPMGLLKTFFMKQILPARVKGIMKPMLNEKIDGIFSQLDHQIEQLMDEKYITPMNNTILALEDLRKKRDDELVTIDALRAEIETDIQTLKNLLRE